MGSLGIAIDGGRYIRIDSSISDLPRNIRLSTLKPGQKIARLDFCSFGKTGPVVRRSVLVDRLPADNPAVSELRIRIERRARALWSATVRRPDGSSEVFRIRTGIGLWPLFILVPLILLAAGWGILRLVDASSVRRTQAVRTSTVKTPAAADVPAVTEIIEDPEPAEVTESVEIIDVQEPPGDGEDSGTMAALETSPAFPQHSVVYFKPESAVLLPAARERLDVLAATMPSGIHLEISGHCAYYGTEKGRRALAVARAEAVAVYLKGRIPSTVVLTTVGFGGDRPVSRDLDTQDLNRRAELTLVNE